MKTGDRIDLRPQTVCPPDWSDLGLRIDLQWRLALGGDHAYGATLSRRRTTKSGAEGKPTRILTLMGKPGESPADVLRMVADALDAPDPIVVS